MSLNYRDINGLPIGYDAWREELVNNPAEVSTIDYDGNSIRITKMYVGNAGKLFMVTINCSADVTKYYGYREDYQGKTLAQNDFDRVVASVTVGEDVFDKTEVSPQGDVVLFFDERYNTHVVNMLASPEAWTYLTRADAETKFNEIIGA